MRSRLPIKYRFAFAISLLVIPLLALLSLLYYWQFRNALNERVLLQLSSIKQLKSVQIEDYLLQEWNLFLSEARHPNDSKSGLINLSDQEFELDKIWPNLGNIKADGIYDLSPYSPDGRILLGFFFDRGQRPVIKISRALKIQEILLERTGMGETGETYLVGSDFHLRSSSRFYPDRSPSMIETQSAGVKRALDGEEGEALINDYRKIPVFSAFGKIEFKSISWAILSELDEKEAHLPLLAMRNRLILILMLVTIFTVLGAFILSLQLVKPLVRMKEYLARMASGAFPEQRITIERDDEIGDMFHALEQLIKSIKQTMMFADEIGRMNLDADYQLLGKGDRLGRSLIAMREKLKIMKLQEEQLQLMTQKSLLQGQERERERLSRDMHDGLGPLLTSLKMMIQRIRMIPEEKEKIKQTLDETISEVRRMTYNLMPQALVDFGVGAALENLVKMTSKASGLNIRYANSMKESRLPDTVNIGLYRIAQEALNNSLKHSGASEIKMSLTEFDDRISFYFEDNGQGFDVTKSYPGSGLLNIKERCRVLNGILHMESNQDGTVLEIEIPLEL